MTYRGDAGGGYAGHHLTVAALEALRPAADNAGRIATVGTPGITATYYISQGAGWQPIAAFALDANGNYIANLVPRTGVEATLLASTAGNLGEIGSATDTSAIVKFNGVVGGAVKLTPYINTNVVSGVNPVSNSKCALVYIASGSSGTLSLAAGQFTGQIIEVLNASTAIIAVTFSSGTSILANQLTRFYWSGTAWILVFQNTISSGNLVIGSGFPSSTGAIVIGKNGSITGPTVGLGAIAIGDGLLAMGANSVAIGNNASSSGANSLAIGAAGASAYAPNSVALGGGSAVTQFGYAFGGANAFGIASRIDMLVGTSVSNTPVVLTTDSNAVVTGASSNEISIASCNTLGAGTDGISVFRIVIIGKIQGTANYFRAIREVVANVITNTATILSNVTPTPDVASAALTGSAIAITVLTPGVLRVTVTAPAVGGQTVYWYARVDGLDGYF
jgi:hypothetical protein